MVDSPQDPPPAAEAPAEIAGRRVRLRPLAESEAPALFDCVDSSRDALKRWMDWVPKAAAACDEEAFLRRCSEEARRGESRSWGVFEARAGRLAGVASLSRLMPCEPARAKLSLWIHAGRQGRGLGSEAVRLLVDLGFRRMGLHRIYARIDPLNRAMRKVLRKAGFRYEGCLRDDARINGRWIHRECWGILRTEWKR
jgi:ribosomal-protein-serine acetyltransferase